MASLHISMNFNERRSSNNSNITASERAYRSGNRSKLVGTTLPRGLQASLSAPTAGNLLQPRLSGICRLGVTALTLQNVCLSRLRFWNQQLGL